MNRLQIVQNVERSHGLSWGELADLEPELRRLLWRARQAGAACASWPAALRDFAPIRQELSELVGFSGRHRRHPVLGTVGAYEVAYWKLYDALTGLLSRPGNGATTSPVPVLAGAR
jgi:hypothetical protein